MITLRPKGKVIIMDNKDEYIKAEVVEVNPNNKNLTNPINNVKRDLAKYLEKDLINERLNQIQHNEDRMFLTFLWMSGVRVTEAINIRKKDIDSINRTIRIRWLKSRKYNERNLPVHSRLADILRVYTASLNQEDLVFNFSRQRAWQICRKYFGEGVGNHTFRHSFAVNYLREGGNIVNLYRILGHKKIQTTMEYLKIVPTDLSKELETIGF